MKVCWDCEINKSLRAFYVNKGMKDGHQNRCIECSRIAARRNRAENIDRIRAYDRERGDDPKRKLANKLRAHLYRSRRASYGKRDPVKRAANVILGNAVRDGKIIKKPCKKCGSKVRVHGHHDDYTKPLKVTWLCPTCHGEHHKKLNETARNMAAKKGEPS